MLVSTDKLLRLALIDQHDKMQFGGWCFNRIKYGELDLLYKINVLVKLFTYH